MAITVNVYEAKTRLSQLLARVEDGEEIIIARHGRPVARLGPLGARRTPRQPGMLRGKIKVGPDFDAFSEAEAADWYGK